MYSISSRDRRVTDYVKDQARKWLYNKIVNDEYETFSHSGKQIIIDIKDAREVTEKKYKEFCGAFVNDPYAYMLNYKKRKKISGITTKHLANYFVLFNEAVLPVGFIKDFFEDDYETRAEIDEYFATYSKGALDEFVIECYKLENKREAEVEKIKQSTPCVFKTKKWFHVSNIIKIVLPLICLILCLNYLIDNNIFSTLVSDERDILWSEHGPKVLVNLLCLIISLVKIKNAVVLVIFYINYIWVRIYVASLQRSLNVFNDNTISKIKDHFLNQIDELKAADFFITDDICQNPPNGMNQYLSIASFNTEKMSSKIQKLTSNKRYNKVHFEYKNNNELTAQKRFWRRGIATSVILLIIISIFNIESVGGALADLISNTPIGDSFDLSKLIS